MRKILCHEIRQFRLSAAAVGLLLMCLWARPAGAFPWVVQPGETLATIAERVYGRVEYERLLVSANSLEVQGGVSIVPGMRIELPAIAYRRIAHGDTWSALAAVLLGSAERSAVLAFANDSKPWLLPVENAEILIPYNLRFVAEGGEAIDDLASRFLGNKKRAWMLYQYNGLDSVLLKRGQVLLIPLTELPLTPLGQDAARQALEGWGAAGGERRSQQLAAARELPALLGDVRAGRYVEAVSRGVALLAGSALTTPQTASVQRQLLEAYAALGATGRASQACRDWRRSAPRARLDPAELSPKLIRACTAPKTGTP
jgi:hypothetical protein